MRPTQALAATFEMDLPELKSYRYQHGKTKRHFYCFGNEYFCISKTKPMGDLDLVWEEYYDQFWAKKANSIIWCADPDEEK